MSECEHDWLWVVGSAWQECAKCHWRVSFDYLRSQLAAAIRERDEARRQLNDALIEFEETDDVRVLVDTLRALAARGTEGK